MKGFISMAGKNKPKNPTDETNTVTRLLLLVALVTGTLGGIVGIVFAIDNYLADRDEINQEIRAVDGL